MHIYVIKYKTKTKTKMEAIKDMGIINVNNLADYILFKYGPMSHLKLQKLVYYSEAYHLAYFQQSLITEDFEAWVHGPVCVELYHGLKGNSRLYSDVGFTGDYDPEILLQQQLSTGQIDVISEILSALSNWSGSELEASTHKELPWINARQGYGPADICNVKISKSLMLSYYKSEIYG